MNFTSFTVECPSCTSVLRVQDAALIGTIATCPRCGSMVLISPLESEAGDPPRQIVAGSGSDSQAITEDAFPVDDDQTLATGPGGFDRSNLVDPPIEPVPESPAALWESEATQKKRQVALIATIAGCSLLTAVLVFSWFVKSWRKHDVVVTQTPANDTETSTPTGATDIGPLVDPVDGPATPDTATEQPPEATAPPASSEPDATLPPDTSPDPAAQDSSVPDSSVATPTESTSKTPLEPPASLLEPWRVDAADPLPDSVAALNRRDPDSAPVAANNSETGKLMDLPPGLAEFLPITNLDASNFEMRPTLDTPQTLNDLQINAPAEEHIDPMMIANPPEPIDFVRALALRLAIDSSQEDLPGFLLFVSQVTGVPIHLDWTSFDIAGLDIDDRVETPKGLMPASELLDAIAKNLHSEARREKSMIVFSLTDDTFNTAQATIANLADFDDGVASAEALLVDFLQLTGEGDVQTQIANIETREDKQLAAFAIDSLRRMRGISAKIPDERFQRWAAHTPVPQPHDAKTSSVGQWLPLNDKKPISQLIAPESVAAVLRMTAKANGASCLVNAYDMRRRGLSPEQLVMPFSGQSGEAMLAKVLAPFRMQVRQVDASHWWLGTEATYDRLPVLIWTDPLGQQRDGLIERFNLITENEIGSEFRLVIDDKSDRALMLLPRFIARQLNQLLPPPVDTP